MEREEFSLNLDYMPMFFHMFCLVYYFVIGIVIGSFLNVCIYRIPKKESIAKGSSHCVSCGTKIKRRDLIPVLSYFLLKGRCRYCNAPFSFRYALVEFLNGVVFLLCALKFQYTVETLLFSIFCSVLIVMAFIDLDTMIIPDRIHVIIIFIGISLAFVSEMAINERIIGFFSVSLVLMLASIISKGGIGGGDIKLMAVSGFVLGYKLILIGFLMGAILASVYGIIVSKGKRENMKMRIPLGPFLALGMILSIFIGNNVISWYTSLMLGY